MKFSQILGLNVVAILTLSVTPVLADSTASLLLSLNCKDYKVQVWQNRTTKDYLYRAQGFTGELSLNKGSLQKTEGVKVYKFPNKGYEYWVWDGTLDSPRQGVLEVYENGRQVMQRTCNKE